jgi:large subunit ribosomal protein L6
VGFTAQLNGTSLKLVTGYSHDVTIEIPKEITAQVQKTSIELSSCDKQLVGQIAAKIRRVCPPEPYLGKGIKYRGEQIRRKAGKTGK